MYICMFMFTMMWRSPVIYEWAIFPFFFTCILLYVYVHVYAYLDRCIDIYMNIYVYICMQPTVQWHCCTYECIMSHMNASCHIQISHVAITRWKGGPTMWMSHATNAWVMSHMNESCHIWMSHVTYEWVTTWNLHGGRAWKHEWMSHVTYEYMNELWHIQTSHGILISDFTYEWAMAHLNGSWHLLKSQGRGCTYRVCCDVKESCHIWICESLTSHRESHMNTSMLHMDVSCHIWMR